MIMYRPARVAAVAAGVWMLVDIVRVWTPSLITLVGQAADTPPELLGLFALGCVLVPFIPLVLCRNHPRVQSSALQGSAAIALVCRIILQFIPGEGLQVIASSLGVIAIFMWLAFSAVVLGDVLVLGVATGLAASTLTHAALGTWGAVWRADGWGWALLVLQAALVVVSHRKTFSVRTSAARTAWLLMPALLIAGIVTFNAGRASATAGVWGLLCIAAGSLAAVGIAFAPVRRLLGWCALPVLLASIAAALLVTANINGVTDASPPWIAPLYLFSAPALIYLLAVSNQGRAARTTSVALGSLVWVVVFFVYYAGYDLGYRADWLIIGISGALALGALVGTRSQSGPRVTVSRPLAYALVAACAVLIATFGQFLTIRPVDSTGSSDHIRVAAYNLRMGYGMSGTFDPKAVADLLADTDVAMLSEVDRGWLLNGGQDQLTILARLVDRSAVFGPAADPVWGDAVLTRLPVESRSAYPLPKHGAVTGAQSLAVQLRWHGTSVWAVSTHLQPSDGHVLAQSRDLARLMAPMINDGASVFLGGDLNTGHGSEVISTLGRIGLAPVFSPRSATPTWPADSPQRQLDHILATSDFRASGARTVPSLASDHLPVYVNLTLK